jgi:hypothetical protein
MAVAEGRPRTSAVAGEDARPWWQAHWLLIAALVCAIAAQARPLSFFFFQDDYVAWGEIVSNGTPDYVWNLLTLQDLTPNWRVMTGLTYLVSYHLFGVSALPTHVVMLVLHAAVVALLYRATWRLTSSAAAAFAAAIVMGTSPAYAGALGQIGSVTYTWGAFFLAAALNACIEAAFARSGRRSNIWLANGALLFVFAIASNESMAIKFPVFGLTLLLLDDTKGIERRIWRVTLRTLPFAAIGFAAAISFTLCDCTAAEDTFGTDNAHRTTLIYLGRLVYPVGLESPQYIDLPHLWAGIGLLSATAVMLARGPAIGRIGVAWMLLAIVPHALIETHTAHRFVYLAVPGFALVAAGAVAWIEPLVRARGAALASGAAVAAFAAVAPWYAWETHLQNESYREATDDWRLLHDEAARAFPEVPPGATVEVIGGPLTHPLDNFFVMPALAVTIWGDGRRLQTFADGDPYASEIRIGGNPYGAEFVDGELKPLRDPRREK